MLNRALASAHFIRGGFELAAKVDLYDGAYGSYELELYRQIRCETYGEDLGQTSWVTNQESQLIPNLLELRVGSSVLEIGCGSGRYALSLAERIGCRVTGVDINANGIRNARQLAMGAGLGSVVDFELCDVSDGLPFPANSFDAVFSNDAICHIPGRSTVLADIFRVLKPAGRALFSDALVVGGMLSHKEITARSSIGQYFFSPPGENERLLGEAGFELLRVSDTTSAAADISKRWFEARQLRKAALIKTEGSGSFEGLQRFLNCVHALASEKRLLRYLYLARKKP